MWIRTCLTGLMLLPVSHPMAGLMCWPWWTCHGQNPLTFPGTLLAIRMPTLVSLLLYQYCLKPSPQDSCRSSLNTSGKWTINQNSTLKPHLRSLVAHKSEFLFFPSLFINMFFYYTSSPSLPRFQQMKVIVSSTRWQTPRGQAHDSMPCSPLHPHYLSKQVASGRLSITGN